MISPADMTFLLALTAIVSFALGLLIGIGASDEVHRRYKE